MTRLPGIGPSPFEAAPQAARDARADLGDRRDPAGRRDASPDDRFGTETRFGQFDLAKGFADDREAAFLDKVRQALGEASAAGADEDRTAPRLLAVAGEAPATQPLPGQVIPASADAAPAGIVRAEAMVERIERAIHASLAPAAAGGPLSISLDLGAAGDGIGRVTVSLSADSLDIVLARSGPGAAGDLASAAQALADRLQARFPRRIVRIFETEAAPPASGALDEISRLLGRPGAAR